MRLLFVSPHPPLPRDSGGRLRTFHLLEELSDGARVRLVCFDREPGAPGEAVTGAEIAAALPALEGVATVAAPARRRRTTQLRSLAGRRSYTLALHRSAALASAVARAAADLRPELVHCDGLFCAWVRPHAGNAGASVLAMHNHESLLKQRLAATAESPARRLLYRAEASAVARLEEAALPAFDHCIAVSELEARTFRGLNGSVAAIPNGVEPLPPPTPPRRLAEGEPLRLLFVGSLNYEPNHRGLAWFVDQVLPLVRARCPVHVVVAGAGRRGPAHPSVEYLGRVADLGSSYAHADGAIVPLLAGAGSRLKVIEALAHGTPLISTRVGVEGFDLVADRHALIADRPQELAESIVRLYASVRTDPGLAASLQRAGYEYATAYFWPRIGERLRALYSGWTASRGAQDRH